MSFRTQLLKALSLGSLVLAPAAFAACENVEVPSGSGGAEPQACSDDADCPSGQGCDADGHCSPHCAADDDCAASKLCHEGLCSGEDACAPAAEACDGHDDDCDGVVDNGATCPGGQTCQEGSCVATPCAEHADCPEGHICKDWECAPGCAEKADCGSGEICKDDECVSCTPVAEECNGDDDDCDGVVDNGASCGPGKGCYGGLCTAAPCMTHADCGGEYVCYFGLCAQACSLEGECPEGKVCHRYACL